MSFNSNGVNLKGQFNLKTTDPIDGRYVITTADEYAALTDVDDEDKALYLYPGLSFTVAPKDDDETDALNNAGVVAGEYQVAADGKTVYKVPKFTIASEIPSPSTPGVLGDIIVVVNTNS
jgi:CubicO group peptidase (beta-lactamase class C family)